MELYILRRSINTTMSLNQLNPFELNDSDHDYSPMSGNDPDVNYFNNYNYNIYSHSKYFSDDIFNKQYHDMQLNNNNQISLLHLNIRSEIDKYINIMCVYLCLNYQRLVT